MSTKIIVIQLLLAYITTVGYAIPANSPKKLIPYSALVGALGYIIFFTMGKLNINYIISSFIAAFFIGLCGETLSRLLKSPATLFVLPAMITLVPGGGMYYSMSHLIEQNYEAFVLKAVETFLIAASLSMGIVFSTIFSRSLKRNRKKKVHRPGFHTQIQKMEQIK